MQVVLVHLFPPIPLCEEIDVVADEGQRFLLVRFVFETVLESPAVNHYVLE